MSYGGFLTAGVVTLGVVSSAEGAFRRKSPPQNTPPQNGLAFSSWSLCCARRIARVEHSMKPSVGKKTIVEYGDRKKINKQKKGIYFFARCLKSCRKPVNTM